ncbi:MAG TPA: choice-of-anchor tandem repeat GloVer-containing protein, partial [Rhizomicrobium sp.]|nr:choice-of-anchor tandem repeat GloVer-containing protein [Rhizomicrobium sp.]
MAQTETVLHSFRGGGHPGGRLLLGKSGALFGTASGGTLSLGNAYELVQRQGVWRRIRLHRFQGTDGSKPAAGLVQGSDGSLYGTTESGGTDGFGTVFELTRSQGIWT